MTPPPARPASTLAFVLLGLMTVVTFAGPFLIFLVMRGGPRPEWPPDRPVEWWVFGAVMAAFAVLMASCLAVALRLRSTGSGGG